MEEGNRTVSGAGRRVKVADHTYCYESGEEDEESMAIRAQQDSQEVAFLVDMMFANVRRGLPINSTFAADEDAEIPVETTMHAMRTSHNTWIRTLKRREHHDTALESIAGKDVYAVTLNKSPVPQIDVQQNGGTVFVNSTDLGSLQFAMRWSNLMGCVLIWDASSHDSLVKPLVSIPMMHKLEPLSLHAGADKLLACSRYPCNGHLLYFVFCTTTLEIISYFAGADNEILNTCFNRTGQLCIIHDTSSFNVFNTDTGTRNTSVGVPQVGVPQVGCFSLVSDGMLTIDRTGYVHVWQFDNEHATHVRGLRCISKERKEATKFHGLCCSAVESLGAVTEYVGRDILIFDYELAEMFFILRDPGNRVATPYFGDMARTVFVVVGGMLVSCNISRETHTHVHNRMVAYPTKQFHICEFHYCFSRKLLGLQTSAGRLEIMDHATGKYWGTVGPISLKCKESFKWFHTEPTTILM
jgi:hypothetical protein